MLILRKTSSFYSMTISTLIWIGLTSPAVGLDITPVSGLEANGFSSIIQANPIDEGSLAIEVGGLHRGSVQIEPIKQSGMTINEINKGKIGIGLGLTNSASFYLSLNHSREIIDPTKITGLPLTRSREYGNIDIAHGYQFLLSTKLMFNDGPIRSGLIIFAESEDPRKTESALTRSNEPKAGGIFLLGLGEEAVEAHFNVGGRYSKKEQYGEWTIGSEVLGGIEFISHLTDSLSLFANWSGRQIEITENNKKIYVNSNEQNGGLRYSTESMDISLSTGKGGPLAEGYTHGGKIISLALTWHFSEDNYDMNSEPEPAFPHPMIDPKTEEVMDLKVNPPPHPLSNKTGEFPLPQNKAIDAIMDDFDFIDEQNKKNSNKVTISEEELVERELQMIKSAEDKIRQTELKRQVQRDKLYRQQKLSEIKSNRKKRHRLEQEANEKIESSLPEVYQKDLIWQGLE